MRKSTYSPVRLRRRKYLNVAFLIIDEMGFEPMTRTEARPFFRFVSYRYERGSIVSITNKDIKDWPELLAGDEVLATAGPSTTATSSTSRAVATGSGSLSSP